MERSPLSPMELFMCFGSPTTMVETSFSSVIFTTSSMPKCPFSESIFRVVNPWAVHPSASLRATPTVLVPTSKPSVLVIYLPLDIRPDQNFHDLIAVHVTYVVPRFVMARNIGRITALKIADNLVDRIIAAFLQGIIDIGEYFFDIMCVCIFNIELHSFVKLIQNQHSHPTSIYILL